MKRRLDGTAAAASRAAGHFRITGELVRAEPFGSGHINDTYRVTFLDKGRRTRYVVQRVNRKVFPDPPAQMRNIERILRHLKTKNGNGRRVLRLVPSVGGSPLWRDRAGEYWRATGYIEGTKTLSVVRTAVQAYEAAKVFGRFQRLLSDLRGPRLAPALPHFHDTPLCLKAFRQALAADRLGRAKRVRREAEYVLANEAVDGVVEANTLHADYARAARATESRVAYAALLIGKETIAFNDRSGAAGDFLEKLLDFHFRLQADRPWRGRKPRTSNADEEQIALPDS